MYEHALLMTIVVDCVTNIKLHADSVVTVNVVTVNADALVV